MSTREIQGIIYQLGVFLFRGGVVNEGMVVARYNIMEAKIEYYFIHTSKLSEYNDAKRNYDLLAHKKLGHIIEVNSIIRAQL
jgi:hypothetical protein